MASRPRAAASLSCSRVYGAGGARCTGCPAPRPPNRTAQPPTPSFPRATGATVATVTAVTAVTARLQFGLRRRRGDRTGGRLAAVWPTARGTLRVAHFRAVGALEVARPVVARGGAAGQALGLQVVVVDGAPPRLAAAVIGAADRDRVVVSRRSASADDKVAALLVAPMHAARVCGECERGALRWRVSAPRGRLARPADAGVTVWSRDAWCDWEAWWCGWQAWRCEWHARCDRHAAYLSNWRGSRHIAVTQPLHSRYIAVTRGLLE